MRTVPEPNFGNPYQQLNIETNWVVYAGFRGWLDGVKEFWGDYPLDEDIIISMWDKSRTKRWFIERGFDEESVTLTNDGLYYVWGNLEEQDANT